MKPIRLEVRGLTSFRDSQEIDFGDLELFAIWGPTGSGKSSLLDAITYALYGKVERVGNEISELISQGQTRCAVLFEFRVQNDTYRIARSTSNRGGPKVFLERLDGEEWISFGERADRVRDVNRMVTELIGLDYEAFTRSVLLPQGKFDEFLTGDPGERRRILTELLGLQLFERMARRAYEIARDAKARADANHDLLTKEYGDVDAEAVKKAKQDARTASLRSKEIGKVAAQLEKVERELQKLQTTLRQQEECAEDLEVVAGEFNEKANELRLLAMQSKELESELHRAKSEFTAATAKFKGANDALEQAKRKLGRRETLAVLGEKLERVDELTDEVAEFELSLQELRASQKSDLESAARAKRKVDTASLSVDKALEAEKLAQELHDRAHRDDTVGSLTSELNLGSPCPVCSRPLESLPSTDRAALERATKALAKAKKEQMAASKAQSTAEKDLALLEERLDAKRRDSERAAQDMGKRSELLSRLSEEVTKLFGATLPRDPGTELDRRIKKLDDLESKVEQVAEGLEEAKEHMGETGRAAGDLASEVKQAASVMKALKFESHLARAGRVVGTIEKHEPMVKEFSAKPEALAKLAQEYSDHLFRVAEVLRSAAAQNTERASDLFGQASRLLPDYVDAEASDIQSLAASVKREMARLSNDAVLLKERATTLQTRLKTKKRLEDEERQSVKEHSTLSALATELRGDRLVAYLQSEALALLAEAASRHLLYLSSGRYRLSFEEDEFYVIDDWNGEERRPVRTLSGGETFLVSLPLALALSDQVQALSVTQTARLDSLFIDEGFGSLDPETLETVVSMIEQLGGDGRVIGVITHVAELAERLPARVNIEKSPTGSRIVVAA